MNMLPLRKITVTTLSPVHIGCDEDFVPTNFVIKDNLLYYLEMAVVADALDDSERGALCDKETIGAIQQFFKSRRDRFAQLSTHIVEVAPALAREYDQKAGNTTQPGNKGESVYNQFAFSRTAYRMADFSPYLPGSSLKGSMRTAWLDRVNGGRSLEQLGITSKDKNQQPRELQQKLLGYDAGKFESDPLRHLRVTDAHHDEESPAVPTQILYAVSKKKKPGPYRSTELNTYLETIPGLLTNAFISEIRLTNDEVSWGRLCDACNAFYWPQLEGELEHEHLGATLDQKWRQAVNSLLADELGELSKNKQGFLLRVGKHSGAESVTLNGARSIKIKGKGGAPDTYRSETTEKRFASHSRNAMDGLLPFGWVWVESCEDEFQWVSSAVRDKLSPHSQPLRETQRRRLQQMEEAQEARLAAKLADEQRLRDAEEASRRKEEEEQHRQKELAAMSPNMRQIEELRIEIEKRLTSSQKMDVSNNFYGQRIKAVADLALESAAWSAEEKRILADMLQEWAGKLMKLDAKDLRKRLRLAALRGQT